MIKLPRALAGAVACGALAVVASMTVVVPVATQGFVHLNPVIDKLSKGQPVFGVQTADLSLDNARALARAPIDFVYIDFEHTPLRLDALEMFLAGMVDRAEIAKRGHPQHKVAVLARFPPYAHENAFWVIKQGLDIGLMGVMVNNIETAEQALKYVQMIRYNRPTADPLFAPQGLRGSGGRIASWFWGVSRAEYESRSDLWPLNPQGDLLFWPMIETAKGVANADAIARVPGVSSFYLSAGGDIGMSLAVPDGDPAIDNAYLSVMKVCTERKLVCGGTVSGENVEKFVKAGYRILRVGTAGGGLTPESDSTLRTARSLLGKPAGEKQ